MHGLKSAEQEREIFWRSAAIACEAARVGAPKPLWEKPQLVAGMASPVVLGQRLYGLRGPILLSVDVKTGDVVSRLRLTGPFSATPVSAGGLLYCVSEAGLIQVVKPGDKEDTRVHSGALGETILATPAIADDALYVRSDKHLWKFARK